MSLARDLASSPDPVQVKDLDSGHVINRRIYPKWGVMARQLLGWAARFLSIDR